MARTADYTRKAINNYRSKFDLVQIRLPKGTKDRAAELDININDIAVSAVLAYLDTLDSQTEKLPQEPEKTVEKENTERTEVEEKVALMQANERLHQLQEQRRAERKASEQPQVVEAEEFLKNINK
jgi:hypothetical protein|nr:MAG TPA: Post-segregation antitoxin CcdA [Bacteriophage sp.]